MNITSKFSTAIFTANVITLKCQGFHWHANLNSCAAFHDVSCKLLIKKKKLQKYFVGAIWPPTLFCFLPFRKFHGILVGFFFWLG